MDGGVCTGEGEGGKVCPKPLNGVREKEVSQLPVEECCSSSSLGPITPDVDREQGDFPMDPKSPLSVVREPSDSACKNACDSDGLYGPSPRTPKDCVFDPFAPSAEDMARAPMCLKYLHQWRTNVGRELHFDSDSGGEETDIVAESLSDLEIFEKVYRNLLQVILFEQTDGGVAEICGGQECDADTCRTPPLAPRLNGIADTCPGAPSKPVITPRNIDSALCKKLAF